MTEKEIIREKLKSYKKGKKNLCATEISEVIREAGVYLDIIDDDEWALPNGDVYLWFEPEGWDITTAKEI